MSTVNTTTIFTTTAVNDTTEVSDRLGNSGIGTIVTILLVSIFFTIYY